MLRKLTAQSFIYGTADFFTKLVQLLVFPVLAKKFEATGFGQLELFMTLVLLLGLIGSCGLSNSVQRYFWDENYNEKTQTEIVTVGLLLLIAFMGLTSLVFMLSIQVKGVTEFLNIGGIHTAAAVICFALSNQVIQFSLDILRLREKLYAFSVQAFISRPVCLCVALLFQHKMNLTVEDFFSVLSLLTFSSTLLCLWLIWNELAIPQEITGPARKLLQYGYPFVFSGIAYWIFSATDRWMIAHYHSVTEVGTYSVAFRIASISVFVVTAFGQAWNPISIKIKTLNPLSYRSIYGSMIFVLIFLMYPVCLFVAIFYMDLLRLLSLTEYGDSYGALILLSAGNLLFSLFQIAAIGISLSRRTIFFAWVTWVTAAINVVLNMILIPEFGIKGAAMATMITQAIMLISYIELTQFLHPILISKLRLYATITILTISFLAIYFFTAEINSFSPLLKLFVFIALCLLVTILTRTPLQSLRGLNKIRLEE